MEPKFEKEMKVVTIVFLVRDGAVILARKLRYIGEGLRNGYGGGLEPEDRGSPERCARRELLQECGIAVPLGFFDRRAIVYFHTTKESGEISTTTCYVYVISEWTGTLKDTLEMEDAKLFAFDGLPFEEMMPGDKYWVPQVLAKKYIIAHVPYAPHQKFLLHIPVAIEVTPEELLQ